MWTLKNMGNKTQGMSFAMSGLWNKNKIRYWLWKTEFWVELTSPVFIELAKLFWVIQCQNKYGNALDLNDHSCLFITETRKMFWCKKLKGYFGKVTKTRCLVEYFFQSLTDSKTVPWTWTSVSNLLRQCNNASRGMQDKRVCHVKDDYVSRRARFNAMLFKIEGRFKILSERVNAMGAFTSSGCEIIIMAWNHNYGQYSQF